MKRFSYINIVLAAFFFISTVSAEEIRIATGPTIINNIIEPIKTPFREKTGLDIKVLANGPVPSLGELEKGNVDVAGSGLQFADWLGLAEKGGVPVKDKGAYTTYVPLTEMTMMVVNSGNKVTALSKEQLRGIFNGKIQNWKEVGGDDSPILVVWPSLPSGALATFQSKIMEKDLVTKNIYDVATIDEIPAAVAGSVEAIGIVNGDTTEKGIKEVAPALERPLTLVYKGKASANLQKFLDFLKQDGKKYFHH